MENRKFDVVVIGGGPGGYALALDCGRRGLRTVVVEERKDMGGTCLNVGCIPSKALLESSELFYRIRHDAAGHGILLDQSAPGPELNLKTMMARKQSVVERLTGGVASLMKARNVEVLHGRGLLTGPGEVSFTAAENDLPDLKLTSSRIILATGSRPASLPHLPFDGKRILDSTDALSLEKVPGSMAVIGAGAVGLELGSIWSRLGTDVTVIEAMDQILPGCDLQAARSLTKALKNQGMKILTGALVESAQVSSRKVKLEVGTGNRRTDNATPGILSVDKVLVAVGRRANLDSALGAGIDPARTSDGRFFIVDENFTTSIPGVYAIGDLSGNPMLAHKAEEEALALAAILAGEAKPPWGGPVPAIVYTEPELAWAGESEESLKAAGRKYIKGQFPFAANGRALASGSADGFVKLLSSPDDSRLLGAVIVGRGASELISEAVTVMAMGGCADDIALTVHGHPTQSEAVREAALALSGRPLHRS